jgi:hypothetical protein
VTVVRASAWITSVSVHRCKVRSDRPISRQALTFLAPAATALPSQATSNWRSGKDVSCPRCRSPVVVELFSQHQQRRCFSERLVFAAQFALKFLDAFLVFARLLSIVFLLGLFRCLAGDEGLSPGSDLRTRRGVRSLSSTNWCAASIRCAIYAICNWNATSTARRTVSSPITSYVRLSPRSEVRKSESHRGYQSRRCHTIIGRPYDGTVWLQYTTKRSCVPRGGLNSVLHSSTRISRRVRCQPFQAKWTTTAQL